MNTRLFIGIGMVLGAGLLGGCTSWFDRPSPSDTASRLLNEIKPFALAGATGSPDDRDRRIAALERERWLLSDDLAAEQQRTARLRGDLQRQRSETQIIQIVKVRQDLLQLLRPEIANGDITIQETGDRLIIKLASPMLFDSGVDQLRPEGVRVLRQVGSVLKTLPDKQIHVEGHADNVPIGQDLMRRFPTNMDLSTARATNAARMLEMSGVAAATIHVQGHADMQPVASNTTEAGRQKNRRVEIIVSQGHKLEVSRAAASGQ